MKQPMETPKKAPSGAEAFMHLLAECLTWADPERYPLEPTQRLLVARVRISTDPNTPLVSNEEEWFALFAWQVWSFTGMTSEAAKVFSRRWIVAELDQPHAKDCCPLYEARRAAADFIYRGARRVH